MKPKTIAVAALGVLGFEIFRNTPTTIAQNTIFNPNIPTNISTKQIALSAGHWIYARDETGAAGEKEMNKLIVEALQPMLEETGWKVIRPDSPAMMKKWNVWEEYIADIPALENQNYQVLEIHGQPGRWGTGVIGNPNDPFDSKLIKQFGILKADRGRYGVTRSGQNGTILEAFASDQLLPTTEQKQQLAQQLARKITDALNEP
ncbi:hypothetical protein NG798_25195 [Ancylothrix sp. C2]|uniref:hypothetical protein n=1 Tax=Ancylothrix sp. D3o TaxID=2953691 RepID=UPI0021BA76D4|nr:hypothetical protein [Ancylothrix sp. D3o]MCT7953098.1 hypothetical protein [Ancylothrix sp. D3o]